MLFVALGSASWIVVATCEYNGNSFFKKEESYPVAYNITYSDDEFTKEVTNSKLKGVEYTEIEAAVEDANSYNSSNKTNYFFRTFVKVQTNNVIPVIQRSFKINSNVQLIIPYEEQNNIGVLSTNTPDKNGTYSSKPDLSSSSRTNLVVVKGNANSKVKITNYGTIEIGGELSGGYGGSDYAGHTAGRYAEIVMDDFSVISNENGTIRCFGYINEGSYNQEKKSVSYSHLGLTNNNVGKIENIGGTCYMPFVLRDYRGGTSMVAVGNSIDDYRISAFNQLVLMNISIMISFDNLSKAIGWANLYTGEALGGVIKAQMNSCDIRLIGLPANKNNYLIEPTDSSFLFNAYYYKDTELGTYDIYGGAKSNGMSLTVKILSITKTISTEDVFFPLSFRQKVVLHKNSNQEKALYSMPQRFKIMAGSYFEVDKGASLEVGELCVYKESDFIDKATIGGRQYPTNKGDGKLVINGELTVNKFGGTCLTNTNSAYVNIKTDASIRCFEAEKQEGSSANPTGLKISSTYNIDETLTLNELKHIKRDNFSIKAGLKVGEYRSIKKNDEYGFITGFTLYDINYVNKYDNSSNFDQAKVNLDDMLTEICRETDTNLGIPRYIGGEFKYEALYLDDACTIAVDSPSKCFNYLNSNNDITIYIKWTKADESTYDIVYSYYSTELNSETTTKTSNVQVADVGYTLSSPSGVGDYEILNPGISKKRYRFMYWVLRDDNGIESELQYQNNDTISNEIIQKYDNDKVINLVAVYECTNYVYVKVNNKSYKGGWHNLIDYDVITSANVSGTQKIDLKKKNEAYVCINDIVTVVVDSSKYADPYCTMKINGKVIKVDEGSTKVLNKNDAEFVQAINNCNGPIIFDAQS